MGPLLDRMAASVASFTADGAYDQDSVSAATAGRHPEAAVIVPPRSTAVPSETAEAAPTQRDRALVGVMTYAFARVGAVVTMRVGDYLANGKRWWVRLHEKSGKQHEMPAHHKLDAFIDEYLEAAGIGDASKFPLFRAATDQKDTFDELFVHPKPLDIHVVARHIKRL